MATTEIIVSFGAPRSGTTFMRHCLKAMANVFVTKLPEGRVLHPCISPDGLIELSHWLQHENLTLVRTVRHPVEIAASFVALRRPELAAGTPNLAGKSDDWIVERLRSESQNVAAQHEFLRSEYPHHRFIEISYEGLAVEAHREEFAATITKGVNRRKLREALATFGTKPVHQGRLSEGLGDVLTPAQRAWFTSCLRPVIEREGYT